MAAQCNQSASQRWPSEASSGQSEAHAITGGASKESSFSGIYLVGMSLVPFFVL